MRATALTLLIGCGADPPADPATPTTPPEPVPTVQILSASVHPPASTEVWLVQQLDVATSEPAALTAVLTGPDGDARTITWAAVGAEHHVPLVGLRANTAYTVAISASTADGLYAEAEPIAFTNGDPPPIRPDVDVLVREPGQEPGWILSPLWSTGTGALVALYDDEAELVWAYVPQKDWRSAVSTGHGTIVGLEGDAVPEVDWLGNVVRRFASVGAPSDIPLSFSGLHHDLIPLEDGGFYLMNAELYAEPAYPLDYDFTAYGDAVLADHVVRRIDAKGALVESFSLAALLDTTRIGYDSLNPLAGGELEWVHANGIAVDDTDDSLVVSLRHQDAVIKIDRKTGALVWIFGNPDGWSEAYQPYLFAKVGDFQWPGHQHAPLLLPGGGLVVFDNGNDGRTTPYSNANGGPIYSRVVAYTLDEVSHTASLDWAWSETSTGPLMSTALGNADVLPTTGNVLATFSFLTSEGGVENEAAGRGNNSVRVIAFSPTTGETVLDVRFSGGDTEAPKGWLTDRAVHLSSLYGTTADER